MKTKLRMLITKNIYTSQALVASSSDEEGLEIGGIPSYIYGMSCFKCFPKITSYEMNRARALL